MMSKGIKPYKCMNFIMLTEYEIWYYGIQYSSILFSTKISGGGGGGGGTGGGGLVTV